MLLLLDINIILDVVFKRPGEPASSAVIGACSEQHQAWVAWHSVATLAYMIERERNPAVARELVTGLLSWARVATSCQVVSASAPVVIQGLWVNQGVCFIRETMIR